MTDDIRDELLSQVERWAVPEGNLPAVVKGGRALLWRRRLATLVFATVGVVVVWAAIENLPLTGGMDESGRVGPAGNTSEASPSPSSDWTTYRDPEEGYTVTYPSDWDRATEKLQPHVEDPEEILSLGSYELRSGGTECSFGRALEDLGPGDAFVSVSESSGDLTSRYMITRPTEFAYDQGGESDISDCLKEPVFDNRIIPFRDGDRFFYAYIAVGKSASRETRDEVLKTLNSLSFEE